MIKRIILFVFFLLAAGKMFAVDLQLYSEDNIFIEKNIDNQVVFESSGYQFMEQDMSYFDSSLLGASTSCPLCGSAAGVDAEGNCLDCNYYIGLGTDVPIGDGLWILLVVCCIYFYYTYNRNIKREKNIL